VGKYTPAGGVTEYRVELRGRYVAVVRKLSTQWRLTIHGTVETDLGFFDSAGAALSTLEAYAMRALDAHRTTNHHAAFD
jgi:hypothetical protein